MKDRQTTDRTTTRPARAAAAALLLVGTLALTGCTGSSTDDNTTRPTDAEPYTRTPDPIPIYTPSPREQNIADAKDALLNYIQVSNAVAQDYYHGWEEKLLSLTTGDQAVYVREFYGQAEGLGYHQVGEKSVSNLGLKNNGYQEDPSGGGLERVEFTACVDYSQVQLLMPDGQDDNASPGRYPASITVLHVPAMDEQGNALPDQPGRWAVDTFSVNYEGAQC